MKEGNIVEAVTEGLSKQGSQTGLGAAQGLGGGLSTPLGSLPLLFFSEFKALASQTLTLVFLLMAVFQRDTR